MMEEMAMRTQKTTIIEKHENENGLPYLAVRSGKTDQTSIPEKDSIDWSSISNAVFAHVIFALGFMMLGAIITLQALAG